MASVRGGGHPQEITMSSILKPQHPQARLLFRSHSQGPGCRQGWGFASQGKGHRDVSLGLLTCPGPFAPHRCVHRAPGK